MALAVGLIALTGCSANQYFMVEKRELSDLDQAISYQRDQLETFATITQTEIDSVIKQNKTSTDRILSAFSEQVSKMSCPPAPAQPACPSSEAAQKASGRADRLKGKVIVGELEKFYLVNPGLVYEARIDSGAETSSLDARNITKFERDGNNWVRFDVPVPNSDKFVTLESEISRRVRIIQSSTDEKERRVVVELQFMIGNHRQQAEFTLTDRGHLSHSVLVGRNILRDVMLIDVGKEFATDLPSPLPNKNENDGT